MPHPGEPDGWRAIVHGKWRGDPRYLGMGLAAMAIVILVVVAASRWWYRLAGAAGGSAEARAATGLRALAALVLGLLILRSAAAVWRRRDRQPPLD